MKKKPKSNTHLSIPIDKSLPKGVRLRPDGTYIADITVGGIRKSRVEVTAEAALAWRKKTEQLMKRERIKMEKIEDASAATTMERLRTTWSLENAIERTKSHIWAGRGGERVAALNAAEILRFFGRTTGVERIDLDWIDSYVDFCQQQGNSGATINRKLSCLSRILRTALERGKITTLPRMPRRRESDHRIRFLTREEEDEATQWLSHIGYLDHLDAFNLLLYTGFRCGELWRLECRDIDFEHDTITAWKTKTSHPRTIPIAKKIRPVLLARVDKVGGAGPIFPGASNDWLRAGWDKVRKYMKMLDDAQFVPHALRHTCATRLAQKGVTMMIIKEWMGHSTIQTTARYTHFAPKDLRSAASIFDEFIND